MALTISDVTYAGEAAEPFITKALTGNETVDGGHIYVQDMIDKKYTIPRLVISNMIQAYSAEPVSQGTMTVDGKTITPQKLMLFHKFNPKDFNDHWYHGQVKGGMLDTELDQSLSSAIIQEHFKYVGNYMNKAIWQSRTTNTDEYRFFTGLVYNALADADVVDTASATTISAANVESQLQLVEDKIRDSVPDLLYDENLKIFCSYKTGNLWEQAQFAGTYKGQNNTERGILRFHGRPVVPIKGIPDNTMIAAKGSASRDSNIWLGIHSMEDMKIEIAPMPKPSDLWYIKFEFALDVQFGFGSEVVLYTTLS